VSAARRTVFEIVDEVFFPDEKRTKDREREREKKATERERE